MSRVTIESVSLRSTAVRAFDALRGPELIRWWNRRYLRILMYHRFTSSEQLSVQCEHLGRYYCVLSLDQVAELLDSGEPFPERAAAVTIDDGYADFATIAHPVFSRYQIPVTVYLVSEFVQGRLWLWWDQIEYAILNSPLGRASVHLPNGQRFELSLNGRSERLAAARRVAVGCVPLPHEQRCAFVDTLSELLQVEVPERPAPEYSAMSWDTVRKIAAEGGVTFGAHTRTHPILTTLPTAKAIEDEIIASRDHIERELASGVTHFCYPNGKTADIGPVALNVMKSKGFRTAVTAEPGVNTPASDRFQLLRIGVEDDMSFSAFQRSAAAYRMAAVR